MPIKHAFTSGKTDGGDSTLVKPSDWNADHTGSVTHAATTGQTATDHHPAPVAGPDADVVWDAAGAAGTAAAFARSLHGHKGVTFTGTPSVLQMTGSPGSIGTAPARGDHVHPSQEQVQNTIVSIVNTAAETSLLSGASMPPVVIPANSLNLGITYKICIYCSLDNRAQADTLTIRLRVQNPPYSVTTGGIPAAAVITMPTTVGTNNGYRIEAVFRVGAIGASVTARAVLLAVGENGIGANNIDCGANFTGGATYDTTQDILLDITAQWSAAANGNVIRGLITTVDRFGD